MVAYMCRATGRSYPAQLSLEGRDQLFVQGCPFGIWGALDTYPLSGAAVRPILEHVYAAA